MLALVEQKQRFFDDGAGPEGSVREISCHGSTSHRLQWSKGPCVQTSGKVEDLAGDLEQAVSRKKGEINVCHG